MSYKSTVEVSRKKAILYRVRCIRHTRQERKRHTIYYSTETRLHTKSRRLDLLGRESSKKTLDSKHLLILSRFFLDKTDFFSILHDPFAIKYYKTAN